MALPADILRLVSLKFRRMPAQPAAKQGPKKAKRTPPFSVPLPTMTDSLEAWLGTHGCRDIELVLKDLMGKKRHREDDLLKVLLPMEP